MSKTISSRNHCRDLLILAGKFHTGDRNSKQLIWLRNIYYIYSIQYGTVQGSYDR